MSRAPPPSPLDLEISARCTSTVGAGGCPSRRGACDEAKRLIPPDSLDTNIAHLANELGAVVVSKDIDFVDLLDRGILRTHLVRVRLPNMMARDTCAAILPELTRIVAAIEAGQRIVEIG